MTRTSTVVVTGASSGLGRGTAKAFTEAGWNVVAVARSAETLEAMAFTLTGAPGQIATVAADVGDAAQVAELIESTIARFGGVDALVNNAAIDVPASIAELSIEDWDRVIGINLSGVFYCCKAVFPVMAEQGRGTIVNISSVAGLRGPGNAIAYAASKFGLTGLTQALHVDGRRYGVRACVVYPGGMDTGWSGEPRPDFLAPDDVGRFLLGLVRQPDNFVVNEVVVTPMNEGFYP